MPSPFRPTSLATLLALPTLAALAVPAVAQAAGPDLAAVRARVSASVYAVRALGANEAPLAAGSAVVIGPGQLVTACQVLAGARAISVRRDNVSYGATLEAPDIERDLCLLRVANFQGPAASVSTSAAPAFGQRVLAVASADASGVMAVEGTVSGLQAGPDGKLVRIESTAALPNAIGGGLFDDSGKLIGVMAGQGQGAQGGQAGQGGQAPLRAVPAAWIGMVGERGAAALAQYRAGAPAARPAPSAPAAQATSAAPAADGMPRVGEQWRYELVDKMTKARREVSYRVDRIEGERVVFNQGARVESGDGRVVRITAATGGDFDEASPPGGWVPEDVRAGLRWKLSYRQPVTGLQTDLTGEAGGESTLTVPAGTFRVLRLSFKGYVSRPFYGFTGGGAASSVPYSAVAWYAPELKRVVRFDAQYSSRWSHLDESLVLVEHRVD